MNLSPQIELAYQRAHILQQQINAATPQNELLSKALQDLFLALDELQTSQDDLAQAHSDRIVSEQRAELERQRYQNLFDLAPDGYVVTDGSGKILAVNQAFANLIQNSPDYVMGKSLGLYLLEEGDRSGFYTRLEAMTAVDAEPQPPTWDMQIVPRHKTPRDVAISHHIRRNAQDNVSEIFWQLRDITARMQIQRLVEQKNQELEQRSVDLTEARDQAEAANRAKSSFLAQMSHELRTPLNAVLGMSEALLEEVFGLLNDQQRESIQTIEYSGNHLLGLINDILDLAKIEAGRVQLDLFPVSVLDICRTSVRLIQRQANNKQISLNEVYPDRIALLMIDGLRVKQVVLNLLNNAVKFTPSGGQITISVERVAYDSPPNASEPPPPNAAANHTPLDTLSDIPSRTPPDPVADPLSSTQALGKTQPNGHSSSISPSQTSLSPTELPSSDELEIAIRDTGIGIAAEHLEMIFQPFRQVDSSLTRQYQGTGLGLALVKNIVELHGGHVTVESILGEGSCFKVYLPFRPYQRSQQN